MATLLVTLKNRKGDRLTMSMQASQRNTPTEHELRAKAEESANQDPMHRQYGPWEAVSSNWQS